MFEIITDNMPNWMKHPIDTVEEWFSGKVKKGTDAVTRSVTQSVKESMGFGSSDETNADGTHKKSKGFFGNLFEGILSLLSTIFGPIIDAIKGFFHMGGNEGQSQGSQSAGAPSRETSRGISGNFESFAEKPAVTGVVETIKKSAAGALETVEGWGQFAKEKGTEVWHKAQKLGGDFWESATHAFEKFGWTKNQSAGIVANLNAESGGNPYAPGDYVNGVATAKGIGQWHAPRQKDFQILTGHAIDDKSIPREQLLAEQIAFTHWELTHTEAKAGQKLAQATTAAEAGAVVSKDFERPGDVEGQAAKRGRAAENIVAELNKREGSQSVGTAPIALARVDTKAAPSVTNAGGLDISADVAKAIQNAKASSAGRMAMTDAPTVLTQQPQLPASAHTGGGNGLKASG